jgi:tape measure domain-containing protein
MADMKVAMIFEAVDRASSVIRGIIGAQTKLNALAGRGLQSVAAGSAKVATNIAVAGAAVAGVAVSAAAAARALIEPGRQFERYNVQLAALEGSADKGRAAMAWITDFAVRTPLELDQVVDSYVQLKSFGLDPTNGTMMALVDTMAANGKGAEHLSGIALALGQAWTKQKLQGEEAMQLLERGVPVWDLLAEATGKSVPQLQKLASAGKLGRQEIQLLIDVMGEKYAGASARMAETFDGILSNIADAWLQFQLAVNDAGLFDWMKGRAQEVLAIIQRMAADGSLATLAREVSDAIVTTLTALWEIGRAAADVLLWIGRGLSHLADFVGGWRQLAMILGGLALAPMLVGIATGIGQIAMGLAMIAPLVLSPLGLVIGAIVAVGAAIYLLVDDWQPVLDWLAGAWDSVVAAALSAGQWISDAFASIAPEGGWVAGFTRASEVAWAGIQATWSEASAFFADLWASITPPEGWGAALSTFASDITAAATAAWDFVAAFSVDVFSSMQGWFTSIGTSFSSIGERFARIGESFAAIGEKLSALFARLGDGVTGERLRMLADTLGTVAGFTLDAFVKGLDLAIGGIELLVKGLDNVLGLFTGETRLDWSAIIPPIEWATIFDFAWADVLPDWNWSAIIPEMPDFGSWFGGGGTPADVIAAAAEPIQATVTPVVDPAPLADLVAMKREIASFDTGAALSALSGVETKAAAVAGAVRTAMGEVVSAVAAIDLTSHGMRLMDTLAAGIRARAGVVTGAIREVTQAVRDHLPSSPAKVGPLSDIHKLKFTETIAASIRPAPMVAAMRAAAAATLAAAMIAPVGAPALAGAIVERGGSRAAEALAATGSGGGGVTVHAPLSLTISGAVTAEVREDFAAQLREHARTIADLVGQELDRRERRQH